MSLIFYAYTFSLYRSPYLYSIIVLPHNHKHSRIPKSVEAASPCTACTLSVTNKMMTLVTNGYIIGDSTKEGGGGAKGHRSPVERKFFFKSWGEGFQVFSANFNPLKSEKFWGLHPQTPLSHIQHSYCTVPPLYSISGLESPVGYVDLYPKRKDTWLLHYSYLYTKLRTWNLAK